MTLEKDEILTKLPKGRLIVAVSGGVDSVVLLHLLVKNIDKNRVIVGHVDHGMRENSGEDANFVEALSRQYGVEFHKTKLNLDKSASENTARQARYDYLFSLKEKTGSIAVLTAHHADDVVETIVMNVLRGTGRRGLSSLKNRETIMRPLLHVTKQEIYLYQAENQLEYVEDETNMAIGYKRNWIRRVFLPKLRESDELVDEKLIKIYEESKSSNNAIDALVEEVTSSILIDNLIDRQRFRRLPENVRREVVIQILRNFDVEMMNISRGNIEAIDEFVCKALPAKRYNPTKQIYFVSSKDKVMLELQT